VTNHSFSTRTNEKVSNYTLWLTIKYIVDYLNLKVTLVKVKGHSDDVYNNIADHIAKSGTQLPPLSINYLKIPPINIVFNFNQITIESSVRYFLKNLFDASNFSAILDLQRNEEIKMLTRQSKVHWKTVWSVFSLNQSSHSTSFHQRKIRSFITKTFMNELPTLSRLEILRPDLYKNWYCVGCNIATETADHIWSYDAYSILLLKIISDIKSQIISLVAQNCSPSLFDSISSSLTALLDLHFAHPYKRNSSLLQIIRGILPLSLFDGLVALIKSPKKSTNILTTAIVSLYERLHDDIWTLRCDLINTKEISLHITSEMKRAKRMVTHSSRHQIITPSRTWELWIQLALTNGYKWMDF
jgi:hypothetical protein